jgi:hypothetical protein
LINAGKKYRNIYILESRSYFSHCAEAFVSSQDLVLTFDFGLKYKIDKLGGDAFYVDNLCSPDEMQKNNILAAEFFKKWHYDKAGNDIFTWQGVPFGFAFRIEIWSEYLYYVRLRANLEQLRVLKYHTIFIGENHIYVSNILMEMGLQPEIIKKKILSHQAVYFFDINKYMNDALHGKSIKDIARNILISFLSNIRFYTDNFFKGKLTKKTVYVQIYHPTKKIVERLLKDSNIRVATASLVAEKGWKNFFFQRLIPLRGRKEKFGNNADLLLNDFRINRCAKLVLSNGTDVSSGVYGVIENQITTRVSEALRILNSVMIYLEKHPIHLEIMIANIGLVQTIVDCVLKSKGVPSYLVMNGLMISAFGDEAKYAKHINGYGLEIKKNYYQNAKNVVCLGDPRMDAYINSLKNSTKFINRLKPIICVGTSGFNPIDLISHVAVEFDFMFDVLTAFQKVKNEGHSFSIVIKVRPNGVLEQYESFVAEYFNDLEVELLRTVPMAEVLQKTDLYISIYSQTLFEASCLGIPVIYYKKDKEFLDPPFDKKSELVTVESAGDLRQAFLDFKANHSRFNTFLDKSVMEKYVGPLDGQNLERNLSFIYSLLDGQEIGVLH